VHFHGIHLIESPHSIELPKHYFASQRGIIGCRVWKCKQLDRGSSTFTR